MSVSIDMKDLVKKYGEVTAIPDLNLTIREGEFFTLLGPSGCGKTTLLRMVAGFNSIEGGTISFNGTVINNMPPKRRDIGMVFQSYAIFPHMTVAKNVGFGLTNRKLSAPEISKRVDDVLETVRIANLKDRLPANMSGGQQQRIALARAIVIEPAVLLMDEPLSNLDAKLRVEMRDVIRNVQRTVGITTVYVTHDQEEALAVSDRIAVMNEGRIQDVGTPIEIYHRPANVFVADFIGKTNLLSRTLIRNGERTLLPLAKDYSVDVTDYLDGTATSHMVEVSIRPEAITASEREGIPATVTNSTFLGQSIHYQAEIEGGGTIEWTEVSGLAATLSTGSRIRLAVTPERLNLFDGETKQSIMRRGAR